MKLCIIGGSALAREADKGDFKNIIVLNRHTTERWNTFLPPHGIDYGYLLKQALDKGATHVLAFSSVGVFDRGHLGEANVVRDYINFCYVNSTISSPTHLVPKIHEPLFIEQLLEKDLVKAEAEFTYWQNRGPRYETPAEINMIRNFAHCVGMTVGSEAQIAQELGLKYSAIAFGDNFANVGNLHHDDVVDNAKESVKKQFEIMKFYDEVLS